MGVPGIENKVAIVTGAARGIGSAYARGLAEAGATVIVSDVLEKEGRATAQRLEKDGFEAVFVRADVTSEASTRELVEEATARFGGVDILVNNAAIYGGLAYQTPTEIDLATWNRVISVNLTGVWLASRAAVPAMRRRGGGAIVNQSSIGAFSGGPMFSHYAASKAAVIGLTKALARDLAVDQIRVNAIAPGGIDTEASLAVGEQAFDSFVQTQLIKRRGTPHDLVGPLLFLAGDASSFMTGQTLVVDGGLYMLG